jgi:hypothetical protein
LVAKDLEFIAALFYLQNGITTRGMSPRALSLTTVNECCRFSGSRRD